MCYKGWGWCGGTRPRYGMNHKQSFLRKNCLKYLGEIKNELRILAFPFSLAYVPLFSNLFFFFYLLFIFLCFQDLASRKPGWRSQEGRAKHGVVEEVTIRIHLEGKPLEKNYLTHSMQGRGRFREAQLDSWNISSKSRNYFRIESTEKQNDAKINFLPPFRSLKYRMIYKISVYACVSLHIEHRTRIYESEQLDNFWINLIWRLFIWQEHQVPKVESLVLQTCPHFRPLFQGWAKECLIDWL